MDLTPYVDNLCFELAVAADAGGEEARALAERLTAPLESVTRLTLLNALSAAADEITSQLAPGSVDVRLRGVDPEFVVTAAPVAPGAATEPIAEPTRLLPAGAALAPTAPPDDGWSDAAGVSDEASSVEVDEGGMARINLRLPDQLKARMEAAASREGLSVNAWLVRTVSATLDLGARWRGPRGHGPFDGRRYSGWVR
jgi:hypothetical protein